MPIRSPYLRKILLSLRVLDDPQRAADHVVTVAELLHGPDHGSVVLPMLPAGGEGASAIEFAAAAPLERVALGVLVRRERAMRIFEIGTFRGVTALTMAANAPEGAILWTLDLPPELPPERVAEEFYAGNKRSGFHTLAAAGAARNVGMVLDGYTGPCTVERLYGDSAKFDFGRYAPVDLFFVDGCHEYDAALRDTRSAWNALRPGGLLVWHDYTWKSVQRAIADSGVGVPVTAIRSTSLAYARKP